MIGYQLRAEGVRKAMDGRSILWSKKIFLDRAKAEAHEEEFVRNCTTAMGDLDLDQMDPEYPVRVRIIELEIVGEPHQDPQPD